jgi:hypothetical protein
MLQTSGARTILLRLDFQLARLLLLLPLFALEPLLPLLLLQKWAT